MTIFGTFEDVYPPEALAGVGSVQQDGNEKCVKHENVQRCANTNDNIRRALAIFKCYVM